MQRLLVALLGALTLVVLVFGLVLTSAERKTTERLDTLTCLQRIHATAAVTALVPDSRVDVEGRVEAVRALSEELDAC